MPLLRRTLLALVAALILGALAAPSAMASTNQVAIMQDNTAINANPLATLTKMKAAGVGLVKYVVYWNQFSPSPTSTHAPANANSASSYDRYFGELDQIDRDAAMVGLKLGFLVGSPAPRWAASGAEGNTRPSDGDFQAFVSALGSHYNGSVSNVPAVRWWSIWNEPNYVPNLAPQIIGSSTYEGSDLYRGLLNAAWLGLTRTGHSTRTDTIVFGDLAPRGISSRAAVNGAGAKPVAFLANLYCVSLSGRRFSGRLAAENGCGSSARAFRAANPALFDASGLSIHPYAQGTPPNLRTGDCSVRGAQFCDASRQHPADPLWADLASISNLENGIDRDLRAYGSTYRFPIWNTEFGYWATPPGNNACHSASQTNCDLSQNMAAYYMNWAEYISYSNPRIASYSQYQLYDPTSGPWTDGLLTHSGAPKPTLAAYELPLYLPSTSLSRPGSVLVWGGVRPAAIDALAITGSTPTVAVQFAPRHGSFKTLATLPANLRSANGYFETRVAVPASGSVRLVYSDGSLSVISRTQAVSVR